MRALIAVQCHVNRRARHGFALLGLVALVFASAGAQDDGGARATASLPHASRCLDSIPPTEFVRMMGFIEGGSHVAFSPGATTPVTADAFVVNAADVFTQEVATETRHQLGARGDTLPLADSVTTWRGIGNGLIVIMRRDGVVSWRATRNSGDSSGAMLLGRAAAVVQSGPARLGWPADGKGDSAAFLMRFLVPSQDHSGHPQQIPVRAPFPVFSINVPIEDPVATKHQARIEYPYVAAGGGISATVVMRFVVDSSGSAVDSTITDTWPSDRPPLNRSDAAAYRSFVTAVRESIRSSRYEPARVGGCPVSQVISQPFIFELRSR